jgi:hypothetical protein
VNLSHDDILKAEDLETREVDVPEWGGSVLLRALDGTGRDAWEASRTAQRTNLDGTVEIAADLSNIRAKLVVQSIVDEDGKRVFTDRDVAALGKKSALVLDRLFDITAEMSGIGPKSAADAEGNSGTAPSDASPSSEQTPPESP